MKDVWTNWARGLGLEPALLLALAALAVLVLALIAGAILAAQRNRRLRAQMTRLQGELDEAGARTRSELAAGQEAMKESLDGFKGDLVRVMGDLARLQKEQSGELDRCLRGQESGDRAQQERLEKLDERLNRRLDESDRRLDKLCERSALPAKNEGAEYLAQGLRLVTEQLKVMSAQLSALERSQNALREPPAVPAQEVIVSEPEQDAPAPEAEPEQDAPRYENTSWD